MNNKFWLKSMDQKTTVYSCGVFNAIRPVELKVGILTIYLSLHPDYCLKYYPNYIYNH